ncbi:sulfotransferase family 2 domain-containing protein [Tateyamaria sp.]|uniref:sulfotransferase family 2 domain-containing protein n=1 Tax=Tateyamaria sp. TaxID=1929288 RepID=UPI00329BBC8B
MGWRGYIHIPKKVVFFWSQKAACTSLFHFLEDSLDDPKTENHYFHLNSQSYKQCMHAIKKKRFRSVILARHPMSRSVSAYLNKFCQYKGQVLRTRADLEPFAQKLHDLFCEDHGCDNDHNRMTYVQFLDTIALMRSRQHISEFPINGHWETQVPQFLLEKGLKYDDILHVENLDAELGSLANALGMNYRSRQLNKTDISLRARPEALIDVPACQVPEHDFSHSNFITPATLRRVNNIYAVDFKAFGYDPLPRVLQENEVTGVKSVDVSPL